MQKSKLLWHSPDECSYQVSTKPREFSLLPYFCFIWNCVLYAKKSSTWPMPPRKSFNSFVQSAVNARQQENEKPNSSVVAETMTLLANKFFGYQIMDRSRHTVIK